MAKKELLELTNHEHIASANGENINARRIGLYGYDYGNSQWRRVAVDANGSIVASIDHGSIGGLGDDDHAQYFLLAGRNGDVANLIQNSIGTTSTQTFVLRNDTAATAEVTEQYSPAQDFLGHAWVAGFTNADSTVRFRNELRPVTGAIAASGLLRWASSVDTGTASFTDRMTLSTAGRLSLPTTGAGAGLSIGGDVELTRGAADRLDIAAGDSLNMVGGSITINGTDNALILPDAAPFVSGVLLRSTRLTVNATANAGGGLFIHHPDATATSGSAWGVRIDPVLNAGASANALTYRSLWWFMYTQGSGNMTGLLALQEGSLVNTNTATVASVWGSRAGLLNNSTGTITLAVGYMPTMASNSTGHFTEIVGYGFGLSSSGANIGIPAITANNQSRFGLKFGSMPDPGVFTGTSIASIWLMGTGGARDGLVFRNNAATNWYAPANSRLRSDGAIEGSSLRATGDAGGLASTITITNVTAATGESVVTVLDKADTGMTHAGWKKIYDGATPYWVPFFSEAG